MQPQLRWSVFLLAWVVLINEAVFALVLTLQFHWPRVQFHLILRAFEDPGLDHVLADDLECMPSNVLHDRARNVVADRGQGRN